MKKAVLFLTLVLLIISCSDDINMDIISLNIRYDNPGDGENAWPHRKETVLSFLDSANSDIIGLQEVLFHQYSYLDSLLSGYGSIFAGRDDGLFKGEMVPVFYKKTRFEPLDNNTFWLSETPEISGSKGWGAVLPRIVTWVKLYDRHLKDEIYFFNTHFSHMSDSARIMSAGILSRQVEKIAGDKNFIISGDFNMRPDSEAYNTLLNGESASIVDSYDISDKAPAGPDGTFNGFADATRPGRIDYIFVREGIKVASQKTTEIKEGSIFISDHWPVVVSLVLK